MHETVKALTDVKRRENGGCHKSYWNEQMMNILIDKKMVVNDYQTHYVPTDKLTDLMENGITRDNCYKKVFYYK